MKEQVLDLMCRRILDKAAKISVADDGENHAKYLELWRMVRDEDDQIAAMFNDFKRSMAMQQIALWKHYDLIPDEKFAQFSPETKSRIKSILETYR
jgi:hypothetical protein